MMFLKYIVSLAATSLLCVACSADKDEATDQQGNNGASLQLTSEFKPLLASPMQYDGTQRANITYQVLVYSFADSDGDGTGDFNGITQNLDYIKSLGANAIWLSPIHLASSYHGYDVEDYDKVNPAFGTEADFDNLVAQAHQKGIKVYLDYVLNHTSANHPWFLDAKHDTGSTYRNWYIFSKNPKADCEDGAIDMLRTEGAKAYNQGEWFVADESESREAIYNFVLDFNKKTITVTEAETADAPNEIAADDDKFIYYGNEQLARMYPNGDGTYHIAIRYSSTWGFLVKTDAVKWDEHKYGAKNVQTKITLGEPFAITNANASNIQFDDIDTWQYHSHFYTGAFADINYGPVDDLRNNAAFNYMVQSAKGWIDRGVDGFRLDAVKHIYHSASSNENPLFLKEFYSQLNSYYKQSHADSELYMVGEVLSGSDEVAPYYAGLPALFEFDFWYRLSDAINGGYGCYFAKDIIGYQQKYAVYRTDFIEATKLSNHDEDRTASVLGNNAGMCRVAAATLLTAGGEPYIYNGEEMQMAGTKEKGDENVRRGLDWMAVRSAQADENSLLSAYRTLAGLRNTYPALAHGTMVKHSVYNEQVEAVNKPIAAWIMQDGNQRILVMHNYGKAELKIIVNDHLDECLLSLGNNQARAGNGNVILRISAYGSVAFLLKD